MSRKYYDWNATFSRQTGTQGEFCIVVGAKNIGKTFGIRKQCIKDFLKRGTRFCEICRTNEEKKLVSSGYFDKLQELKQFENYIFKTNKKEGYIAKRPAIDENGEFEEKPDWKLICYFVSLTSFQTEKKRTYTNISRFIFDEAIIDRKDRYHRYLNSEYLILANILDSISRQQPDENYRQYRVYLLGNACDMTAPYMRYLGINKIPDFGYSYWNNKHTLLHYVEPIDKEEMIANTLVGRMLSGMDDEAEMIYGNKFNIDDTGDIENKTSKANFKYGIIYNKNKFGIWLDYSNSKCYITSRIPRDSKLIFCLTKDDSTIDYLQVERSSDYLQIINKFWYTGMLRYDSVVTRELFLSVLNFLGVR